MCGRYALALRASQIRQMLRDDNMAVDHAVDDDDDAPDAPRPSYNVAPGCLGVVYRADTPGWGAGPRPDAHARAHHDKDDDAEGVAAGTEQQDEMRPRRGTEQVQYKLQAMRWGLVPSWTRRKPDYQTMMRTINCRDDSLSTPGGMWASMKSEKRCVVVAQGFFEWLKTEPREKLPHYAKRKDGRLMCFAGLWDCVRCQGSDEKLYTYTIITTDANEQLRFLHDRMPVIFDPGSDKIKKWLDPGRHEWSRELQSLLRPFDGELQVYPVNKDVGKVGNNSPSFIVPLDSKENKSNIANFFSNAEKKEKQKKKNKDVELVHQASFFAQTESQSKKEEVEEQEEPPLLKHDAGDASPTASRSIAQEKRKTWPAESGGPASKKVATDKAKISSTKNEYKSPRRSTREPGTQKITSFFGNSA